MKRSKPRKRSEADQITARNPQHKRQANRQETRDKRTDREQKRRRKLRRIAMEFTIREPFPENLSSLKEIHDACLPLRCVFCPSALLSVCLSGDRENKGETIDKGRSNKSQHPHPRYDEDFFKRMTASRQSSEAMPLFNLICLSEGKIVGAITSRVEEMHECEVSDRSTKALNEGEVETDRKILTKRMLFIIDH